MQGPCGRRHDAAVGFVPQTLSAVNVNVAAGQACSVLEQCTVARCSVFECRWMQPCNVDSVSTALPVPRFLQVAG